MTTTKPGPQRALKPPTRWLKTFVRAEEEYAEDVWYYFEVDEDGWELRHVELSGTTLTPTAAASLAELLDADVDGIDAVRRCESRYGMTAERSLADADDGFEPEEIEQSEFDSIWARARSFLDEKQMGLPDRP